MLCMTLRNFSHRYRLRSNMPAFRVIGIVSVFTFTVLISPLLIILYLSCWLLAKFASFIYGFKQCKLLTGMDTIFSLGTRQSIDSIINGLLLTQDSISVGVMKETVADKIIAATDGRNKKLFPKFTRCLIQRAGFLMWSEAKNFNVDEHICEYHGQPPHNEAELRTLVNDLCNELLPPSRPGWQFTVIPLQYPQAADSTPVTKTCVLLRIHHSICDGIALQQILFEILGSDIGAMRQVLKMMNNKFETKFRITLMKKFEMLIQIARAVFFAPAIMWTLKWHNDQYLLRQSKLSGIKIYDWSSPIKLSIIKDIKNATSTTVNDVITSCLAAALRKVFLKQGACPPQLHSLFLMSLHGPDDHIEAKNNAIFTHSPLPTGEMGRFQRLKSTKAIMDIMKRSPDVMVNHWLIIYLCGIIPHRVIKWFLEGTHKTVLLSNLPGPSSKLHFVSHIDSIVLLAQIRDINDFGVLVHSCGDEVLVSVTADKAIINHKDCVRLLLKEFVEEIKQLHCSINV